MMELAMELVMMGAEVYVSSMYGDIQLETAEDVEAEFEDAEAEGYSYTYEEIGGVHYFYVGHEDYDE